MKHLAFIISFFILSAALTPLAQLIHFQFAQESCEEVCLQSMCDDTLPSDCEKQGCDPFFCCIKLQILLPNSYKNLFLFPEEDLVRENFAYCKSFIFLQSFDIWHPPQSL